MYNHAVRLPKALMGVVIAHELTLIVFMGTD